MIRRIWDIISWPFDVIFQIISFPFFLLKLILEDRVEQQKGQKRILKKLTNDEISEVGKYLFPDFKSEFETFIGLYLKDTKKFIHEHKALLLNHNHLEMNKLKTIDVIYIFGDSRKQMNVTDWRGEENQGEIEGFLEENLQVRSGWKNTNQLRKGLTEPKQSEEAFIIELFKVIDKDLKPLSKKLLFLDLGWDSYVYTIVDLRSHKILTDRFGSFFQGTENL